MYERDYIEGGEGGRGEEREKREGWELTMRPALRWLVASSS